MNYRKIAEKIARKTELHYGSLGARIKVTGIETIGRGERYILDIKLKQGTREQMVYDRARDVQVALKLYLFQPFFEDLTIRIAVSERPITENSLKKMLPNSVFTVRRNGIPIALGYTVRGEMYFADLVEVKHALYGGSTGSGKSVGLQNLVISIITHQPVSRVNLLLFDIGANSLAAFEDIPHLAYSLIKDSDEGIYVMLNLVAELDRRVALSNEELQELPYIVCVIDEYVSLVSNISDKSKAKKLTDALTNLLRRGRHAKIICILATQDPKAKNMLVDLGNITARMAYTCAKYHNSITILGESGAEKLPGKGAMLFKSPTHPEPIYIQGAYMAPDDINTLVQYISKRDHDYSNMFYIPDFEAVQDSLDEAIQLGQKTSYSNQELADVISWTLGRNNVSVNQIQKKFRMGDRADDLIEEMASKGVVGPKFAKQPRDVLLQTFKDIPIDVVNFLIRHGISEDDIKAAFGKHNTDVPKEENQ